MISTLQTLDKLRQKIHVSQDHNFEHIQNNKKGQINSTHF